MTEIDEIIEAHGAWPAAFRTRRGCVATVAITPPRRLHDLTVVDIRDPQRPEQA